MNKTLTVKKIIIVVIAAVIVVILALAAIRLPVYMHMKTPFKHIIKGYGDADSREIFKALPEALVDKMDLTEEDYDEIDDALQESSDDFLCEILNDDDYKFKVKILGYKKVNDEQRESLMDMYETFGVDIDIKKAYYTDFKLSVKSPEDDLSVTYGIMVGKVDGEWCIVGGDMVTMAALIPSMSNYVNKSKLMTANSNAKMAYKAVAEYVADMETKGYSLDVAISKIGGETDCRGIAPSGDRRIIYDALSDNGENAGIVNVFKAEINGRGTFCVQWRESEDSKTFGQYPDAISWDSIKENGNAPRWGSFYEYRYDYDY